MSAAGTQAAMARNEKMQEVINCLEAAGIRPISSIKEKIDMDAMGEKISSIDGMTEIQANSKALRYIVNERAVDDELLEHYQEEFSGWDEKAFELLDKDIAKTLKSLLRTRGIYAGHKGEGVVKQLFYAVSMPSDFTWPEHALLRTKSFHEDSIQNLYRSRLLNQTGLTTSVVGQLASPPPTVQQQPQPAPELQSSQTPQRDEPPEQSRVTFNQRFQTPRFQTPRIQTQTEPFPVGTSIRAETNPIDPGLYESTHGAIDSVLNTIAYNQLPPVSIENTAPEPQAVATFAKLWDTKYAYSGAAYDVLDDKIRYFMTRARIAHIKPSQLHALVPMMLIGRAGDWFISQIGSQAVTPTFTEIYAQLKKHFDTEINRHAYYNDWTQMSFRGEIARNPTKNKMEVLTGLLDRMQLCQRALGPQVAGGDAQLRHNVERAVAGAQEFKMALFDESTSFEHLSSKLRSALQIDLNEQAQYVQGNHVDSYYTDRHYRGRGKRFDSQSSRRFDTGQGSSGRREWKKKCYVCGKLGCFSTKHPQEDRDRAFKRYKDAQRFERKPVHRKEYQSYLIEYEGEDPEGKTSDEDEDEEETEEQFLQFFTSPHAPISIKDCATAAMTLANKAAIHRLTYEREDDNVTPFDPPSQFLLDRYSRRVFQGILPDTGAAKCSTGGYEQYQALQHQDPTVQLDCSHAREESIRFGDGQKLDSLGTVTLDTPIGVIRFHIMPSSTPFLLCLQDMDALGVYLNNVTNMLVISGKNLTIPIIRKWGHPWFFIRKEEASVAFLTQKEMFRLHCRFGHPSVSRLYKLLHRSGHDAEMETLETIKKFCHYCQVKGAAPQRFKFTLKKDREFNYEIIVDIMQLENQPVLHVVDWATSFQAARFLPEQSAKVTWETLRACWIDTYLGPPDILSHDAGTNFAAEMFRIEAKMIGVTCVQVPVEAHQSIGKVERYHAPLRRAFEIITLELDQTPKEVRLQMAVKACNDTMGPDGYVPTLLVFGAYPRMTYDSPPSATTMARAKASNRAMIELRKLVAQRKVRDAVNTRNGPNTADMLPANCAIGDEVLVYREPGKWTGPYKVLGVGDADVTVDMVNGPTTFRTTIVKPYLRHPEVPMPIENGEKVTEIGEKSIENAERSGETLERDEESEAPLPFQYPEPERPRRRGRPPGAKNKSRVAFEQEEAQEFLSSKEIADQDLAIQLRAKGKITTPGEPFEKSDEKEVNMLFEEGVLEPTIYDTRHHGNLRIFKSRMVREIKGKNTNAPYEKSRLVVQGYGDDEKHAILTQAPTIQRCSQRLLLAIAPYLRQRGHVLTSRDITQAYPQSKSQLAREIFVHLPHELKKKFPQGTILRVVKPLYGIPEAGMHWFATYQVHHLENLHMETSTYDPCLLITKDGYDFGITALQTDDTLYLGMPKFMESEQEQLDIAGFKAKPRQDLTTGDQTDFNGCRITILRDSVIIQQKGQAQKLQEVKLEQQENHVSEYYVRQRARGAYLASICQPEATFDYSIAAQTQHPTKVDVERLNKRIRWQMANQQRSLTYVPIDLATAKLFVFTDGSFANNHDLSSQIGYIVLLANIIRKHSVKGDYNTASHTTTSMTIRGNILHWSSVKCKRVTRSVLASEIYGLVSGFDQGYALVSTLNVIADRLHLPRIPLSICTDSYSLYECLAKLGTTGEKRLMIDVMGLRQSYERHEIEDIHWINGADNPADAMTKANPNKALETLVSTNELTLRLEGWVQRTLEDDDEGTPRSEESGSSGS